MITNRIAIFAAAAGFLGMAGLVLAKEKGESGMSEYTKGNQFFEAKQYEQAVAEFAKAIEANSKQPARDRSSRRLFQGRRAGAER